MLATQDVCVSRNDELRTHLIQSRRALDVQELAFAQAAADFAASDAWEEDGSVSAIDWMRFNCHMTAGAAANAIAVGETLAQMPESHQALVDAEIGYAHVAVMARTAQALGDRFDERLLVDKARESSPGKFFYICHHARHAADPKQYAAEEAERVEQRRLKLSTWMDGSLLISGVLDPVGGAAVRTALEPLARKSGAHDDRDLERRQADALVELASGGGSQAQLQVTTSLETLMGLLGAPAAEMEHSLPVSSETVERLSCDSSIARVLLDSESVVVDVGRSRRVVSEPARRALAARDGQCRWPRCDRPPSRSAAHHVVHWIRGGPTDLDNLILLCHRHHRMVHEGGWQLVKSGEGSVLTIPPTVTFGPPSRAPD
ncbi:MAG TPA: DUF222 domain-containing protein [Candidatus Dormibacteraeota bacterium]|nr:DUF222 domain-containing protein [Candidatus Dormibacteraeota bacterium]